MLSSTLHMQLESRAGVQTLLGWGESRGGGAVRARPVQRPGGGRGLAGQGTGSGVLLSWEDAEPEQKHCWVLMQLVLLE